MLESLIQWIWSADFRRLESHYGDVVEVGELFVPLPELLTLGLAVSLALAAWAALRYTDLGKAMRATAEDAPIAAAFGVNEKLLSLCSRAVRRFRRGRRDVPRAQPRSRRRRSTPGSGWCSRW